MDARRQPGDDEFRLAALVFDNIQEGIVITDPEGNILAANPAVSGITGYERDELVRHNMRLLQSGRHDRAFYEVLWNTVRTAGCWRGEIWNRRKSGEIYPELLTISAVRGEAGAVTHYIGSFSDITALKSSQARMEYMAHHDALTGLPNRAQLLTRLEHALERAQRHGGLGAVLFMDLDHFKQVNDTFGHPVGDALLVAVGQRLKERLRDVDTLARIGGDEFVVVLEHLDHAEQAAALAQALIARISEPCVLPDGHEVRVGVSIGIALFPQDGMDAAVLISLADAALYAVKQSGRGTYRFHRAPAA